MADPPDLTVSENRRLQREVKQLRARVEALESSRWWRLHPRLAVERLRGRFAPVEPPLALAPATRIENIEAGTTNGLTERFREEVMARGEFTEDWFTVHIPAWDRVARRLDGRETRILELGSFEGLSACFLLWRLPAARITCVDTFSGIPAYNAYGIGGPELEQRFDRNVALVDGSRVRKLTGATHRVLPELVDSGERFDLAYVDASHRALDVIVDSALCWQLLVPDGIAIFDDYGPIPPGEDPLQHPAPAIDAFLRLVGDQLEVVEQARQLVVRKARANERSRSLED
jgi:SAM-dependent methyltransferase